MDSRNQQTTAVKHVSCGRSGVFKVQGMRKDAVPPRWEPKADLTESVLFKMRKATARQ